MVTANGHIRCPECSTRSSRVLDSRGTPNGAECRRRRKCENGHRWNTYEISENDFDILFSVSTGSDSLLDQAVRDAEKAFESIKKINNAVVSLRAIRSLWGDY